MAITTNLLASAYDSADATVYVTSSITTNANSLILAAFATKGHSGTAAVSGASLSFATVATISNVAMRLTVFRARRNNSNTGVLSFSISAGATAACWIVSEFLNVDGSGSAGAGAVVQFSSTARAGGLVGGSLDLSLGAFASSTNAFWGVMTRDHNDSVSPAATFVELADVHGTAAAMGLESQWTVGAAAVDNVVTFDTFLVSRSGVAAIAIEIAQSAGAAAAQLFFKRLLTLGVGA